MFMKRMGITLLAFLTTYCAYAQQSLKETEYDEHEKKQALQHMIDQRSYPGNGSDAFSRQAYEWNNFRSSRAQSLTANWSYVDASGNHLGDVGRANSVTLDTLVPGKFYVCTPHSGVWLTTNNGISYTPITEQLPTQSASVLVISPANNNVLYLATGAHNQDMPRNSLGVFKSVDGGQNWQLTGLTFNASAAVNIGDLIINPQNPNSLLAATDAGLYRTYDGGANWTQLLPDMYFSVRFKPGDTTTIYAAGRDFVRSVNSGNNFTIITSGISNNFSYKFEYAVRTCKAVPADVYLMCCGYNNALNTQQTKLYRSTDSGQNFAATDSILNEPMCMFDVSQQTPGRFMLGYRNSFIRSSQLQALQPLSVWNTNTAPYVHADQRGMYFDPRNDSVLFLCNDGGVYRSTNGGISFQNITANMQLAHLYNLSQSQQTNYKIIAATLDVPPYQIGNAGIDRTFLPWIESFGTRMSAVNDSVFFFDGNIFTPLFTDNNYQSYFTSSSQLIGNVSYRPQIFQYDPCQPNVCYFASYFYVYKSTDYGRNFSITAQIQSSASNWMLNGYTMSEANPTYAYGYYRDSVFATYGGPYINISNGLPIGSAAISHMVVDPANKEHIWLCYSGFSAGNKVFFSADGGQTWVNRSAGLPNVPVNVLVCQEGIPGAVYAGTDGGVFYIDDSFSAWQLYSTGLPALIVTDLQIQKNLGKLRAATFGRGVWESDLYQPTPANYVLPPSAIFSAVQSTCVNEAIQFTPANLCRPATSHTWYFPGGNPSFSTMQSPVVTYSTPGQYSVTLVAQGPGGSDSITISNYINIRYAQLLPYAEPVNDQVNPTLFPAGFSTTDPNGDFYSWTVQPFLGSSSFYDQCLLYDNFNHYAGNVLEKLSMPDIDLSSSSNPWLYFSRAYQLRFQPGFYMTDTLLIEAASCNDSGQYIYQKGDAQLATVPGNNPFNAWQPQLPSEWVRDSVSLQLFAGQPNVRISFVNKGNWGQAIYLDSFEVRNVLITEMQEAQSIKGLQVFPNPAQHYLQLYSNGNEIGAVRVTDISGRTVLSETIRARSGVLQLGMLAPGIYLLQSDAGVIRFEKI
jgi:hypothetical protein